VRVGYAWDRIVKKVETLKRGQGNLTSETAKIAESDHERHELHENKSRRMEKAVSF
jgi:hypothetical protein